MAEPDWASAEDLLFERSVVSIRQFAAERSEEVFATFAFTVDSLYTGVALNFDTWENSLAEAQRQERYQVKYRDHLFATDHGWRMAGPHVASYMNRVDDWNSRGSFRYDLVSFIELKVWENYFNESEECSELEGRVIISLWRVACRLVDSGTFDGLQKSAFFRIAFSFHDGEMTVLRVLNWPTP